MDLMEKPKEWLWHVAFKKALAAVAGAVAGFGAHVAAQRLGITLSLEQTADLTGWLVTAGATVGVVIHDALKLKHGDKWWGKILL